MRKDIVKNGLMSAVLVTAYIAIVVWFMTQIGDSESGGTPEILMGMGFLLLFVLSATVVGLGIFAKPVLLYMEGKKEDALMLLSTTVVFLLLITVVFLSVIYFT